MRTQITLLLAVFAAVALAGCATTATDSEVADDDALDKHRIALRFDRAGRTIQLQKVIACRVRQEPGCASQAVAALFDFTAITVKDPVACHAVRANGWSEPHHLVEAGTGAAMAEYADYVRGRRETGIGALVDNENLVAGALHFQKRNQHRHLHAAVVVYIKLQ